MKYKPSEHVTNYQINLLIGRIDYPPSFPMHIVIPLHWAAELEVWTSRKDWEYEYAVYRTTVETVRFFPNHLSVADAHAISFIIDRAGVDRPRVLLVYSNSR